MDAWDEAMQALALLKANGLTISNVVVVANCYNLDDSDNNEDSDDDGRRDGAALLTEVYKVLVLGGMVDILGAGEADEWWYYRGPYHDGIKRLFFDGEAYDFAATDDEEPFDHNHEVIHAGVAALEAVDQAQVASWIAATLAS
jgi:hypothetical protein